MPPSTGNPRPFGALTKFTQRLITRLHITGYRLTGGAIGARLGTIPCLLLTTTGRKTGKSRTTVLTYAVDGDRFILIASNGGTITDPIWWRNLQANPHAAVQLGRQRFAVTAQQADPAERDRLWDAAVRVYAGYTGYQERTPRQIPVVVLARR